jgi:archaellum component FlaC
VSQDQAIPQSELDMIAERLAKIHNVPVEEAKKILQTVFSERDRLDRIRSRITKIKELKPVLDEMPEEVRDAYYKLFLRETLDSIKDEDFDRYIKYLILKDLREGGNRNNNEIQSLRAELAEIKKTLESIIQAQQSKTIEDITKSVTELSKKLDALAEEVRKIKESPPRQGNDEINKVLQQIESLRKDVEELKKQPQSFAQRIDETFKEVESIKNILMKHRLIPTPAEGQTQGSQGQQLDPEQMAEILKRYGYEVKKLTPDEVEKILAEHRSRVRAELERELQVEKARAEAIKDIVKSVVERGLGPIIDAFAEGIKNNLRYSIAARLSQIQQSRLQTQAVQQAVKTSTQTTSTPSQSEVKPGVPAEGHKGGGGEGK